MIKQYKKDMPTEQWQKYLNMTKEECEAKGITFSGFNESEAWVSVEPKSLADYGLEEGAAYVREDSALGNILFEIRAHPKLTKEHQNLCSYCAFLGRLCGECRRELDEPDKPREIPQFIKDYIKRKHGNHQDGSHWTQNPADYDLDEEAQDLSEWDKAWSGVRGSLAGLLERDLILWRKQRPGETDDEHLKRISNT